jgi:hypothetical protein
MIPAENQGVATCSQHTKGKVTSGIEEEEKKGTDWLG